jgi:Methyltransferase domain
MRASLPPWIHTPLAETRRSLRALRYAGSERHCPVCGTSARVFLPFGTPPRPGAMCPRCDALERHRLVWLYFQRRTDLFDGRPKRFLHVAPERCFESRLRKCFGTSYISADLASPRARIRLDITCTPFPNGAFDVVYCSHVLQYVPEDRRAMREIGRLLGKDAWAVFMVPITEVKTLEDPSVVDPKERLRLFGREDQVRRYGADFVDRLRESGFQVTVTRAADLCSPEETTRLGLAASGAVFHCRPQ